ncbi:DJ-1/PfpI family protein [Microbispora sp. CA-135349]|uniref:DJ-1/PfpI family protein n=1 Tax=Microbispora sp. CA-135349 TaxID=3239953 RepID=UPI003D8FDCBE
MSIPQRIFSIAAGADGEPLYEVLTCGVSRTVRTDADFSITVDHDIDVVTTADTLVIPPFAAAGVDPSGWLPAPVADALARLRPGVRLVSICTAAFVLAAAGLLDGRPATTHPRGGRAARRSTSNGPSRRRPTCPRRPPGHGPSRTCTDRSLFRSWPDMPG